MATAGRPKSALVLSGEERATLEGWAGVRAPRRRWRCGVGSCWRPRRAATTVRSPSEWGLVVARWASGVGGSSTAGSTGSTMNPVRCTRSIGDDDVERVIVKTLEETPANTTHWSTRSLAASTGVLPVVSRIWRAFGLKPHLVDSFKLSPDPLFIDKVRDIVGLYLNPPTRQWCCVPTKVTDPGVGSRPRCCRCCRGRPSGAP